MPVTGETWADGKQISSDVTIASGVAVTIAPGATITIAANATITIAGTLTANSVTPPHAKLTGSGWGGVVVASGGTLSLNGVDILGAQGLTVKSGAGMSEYDNGIIDSARTPFSVEAGGALTTKGAKVTGALGGSQVVGSFTASHLDYDSNGNAGITTLDPGAALSIEDSTLHGSGPSGDFLVSSGGAATFHVAYTDISNVHCGFHFDAISTFDISYTNVHGNQWGFMLYGSGTAGTRSVSNSNIENNAVYAYETQGTNGPITFDHCHVTGQATAGVSVTNAEPMTVMGTGPRP
jgi:hypothetical protein